MDNETKAANEALVESMLRQLRGCVSVGDEMTLDHACLIDDAADWIAGEPARLAAALENLREADRRALGAFDSVLASLPLDATPLADELRTLRAALDEERIKRQEWQVTAHGFEARVAELEANRAEHRKIAIDNVNAAYAEAARMQQIARMAEAQVAAARETAGYMDDGWRITDAMNAAFEKAGRR